MNIKFRCNNKDIKYILDDIYFCYDKNDKKTLHPITIEMLCECVSSFFNIVIGSNFNYTDEDFYNWFNTYKFNDLNTGFIDIRILVEDIIDSYISEKYPEIDETCFISSHMEEFYESIMSQLCNYAYRRHIEEENSNIHYIFEGNSKYKISIIHRKK